MGATVAHSSNAVLSRSDLRPDFGALVISLDFELYWGVYDLYRPPSTYDQNVQGARQAIPEILALFAEHQIAATWAAVGMLFARSAEEAACYCPQLMPTYRDQRLRALPLPAARHGLFYYAPDLMAQIGEHPRQEIGTHTFSHYYCMEPGQQPEEFEADVIAAKGIARANGRTIRSITFPRNQVNPAYIDVLQRHGILNYRGPQRGWLHAGGTREVQRFLPRRAGRLAAAYLPMAGKNSYGWEDIVQPDEVANVRASRYLRPFSKALGSFHQRHLRIIISELEHAACNKQVFHLWWHPEDVGSFVRENIECVRSVCEAYTLCRRKYGMRSMSMSEAAGVARAQPRATT